MALLFLIPGRAETLRVNGRANTVTDPDLLERFAVDGKQPKCVLAVDVETVFFQCGRDGAAYDRELPERQRTTLY